MSDDSVRERLGTLGGDKANYLVGQISTLLDSIIVDERQAKAAKDLARKQIWDTEYERGREETYILNGYRRNPEMGLFPKCEEEKFKKEDKES